MIHMEPKLVKHSIDISLKNLQLDYLDLYLIHFPVPFEVMSKSGTTIHLYSVLYSFHIQIFVSCRHILSISFKWDSPVDGIEFPPPSLLPLPSKFLCHSSCGMIKIPHAP